MTILINGESRELSNELTLRQLLSQLNLVPEKVAIELNRRLAHPDKYDTPLNDGDAIEIVTFVGGG
jgi:thiamine biosynthesis protein ThiS